MKISSVSVRNFRALRDVAVPVGAFSCVIGENNVGKSSFLQAVIRLSDGKKLVPTDYYDPALPVRIAFHLVDIAEEDLESLAAEHRDKIRALLVNGSLTLVRAYGPDGSGNLQYVGRRAREERFWPETVSAFTKGKSGAVLRREAAAMYPEIAADLPASPTQTLVRELVERHRGTLGAEATEEVDLDIPTGIDNSVVGLLPEPVYIPAVKDIGDEVKMKEGATFGKVMGVLLSAIEPDLIQERQLFADIERKLTRTASAEGIPDDQRLPKIREMETVIQDHLIEHFPQAKIEIIIPPPTIKSLLSGARIEVDDGGIAGPVETKGDGLKRSVLFAIFRTYVELAKRDGWQREARAARSRHRYLFLFEEPELYLHPAAQRSLFDALGVVAEDHQVVVTTHSPLFYGPGQTTTFVKMRKRADNASMRPFAVVHPVDFPGDLSAKETFQLVCFENNSAAFFANKIVLVEGDSDVLVLKHIARVLNPEWDFEGGRATLVRVAGKGNFRRFCEFFQRFAIEVSIITDLDSLVGEFDKLAIPAEHPSVGLRSRLLQRIDEVTAPATPPSEVIREALHKRSWRERWEAFRAAADKLRQGEVPSEQEMGDLALCIEEQERAAPRVAALRDNAVFRAARDELIESLRGRGIHILKRGTIEDYYPGELPGSDKITRAEEFTRRVTTREDMIPLVGEPGTPDCELGGIFAGIF